MEPGQRDRTDFKLTGSSFLRVFQRIGPIEGEQPGTRAAGQCVRQIEIERVGLAEVRAGLACTELALEDDVANSDDYVEPNEACINFANVTRCDANR